MLFQNHLGQEYKFDLSDDEQSTSIFDREYEELAISGEDEEVLDVINERIKYIDSEAVANIRALQTKIAIIITGFVLLIVNFIDFVGKGNFIFDSMGIGRPGYIVAFIAEILFTTGGLYSLMSAYVRSSIVYWPSNLENKDLDRLSSYDLLRMKKAYAVWVSRGSTANNELFIKIFNESRQGIVFLALLLVTLVLHKIGFSIVK